MVHLFVIGDCDPVVLVLDLAPVKLVRKGGDMRFWSVAPCRKEVRFDSQILLGGDNIPLAELGNQYLDPLVFLPCVILLELLNALRMDGGNNGFDRHRVNHLLEGVLLPLYLQVRLEL